VQRGRRRLGPWRGKRRTSAPYRAAGTSSRAAPVAALSTRTGGPATARARAGSNNSGATARAGVGFATPTSPSIHAARTAAGRRPRCITSTMRSRATAPSSIGATCARSARPATASGRVSDSEPVADAGAPASRSRLRGGGVAPVTASVSDVRQPESKPEIRDRLGGFGTDSRRPAVSGQARRWRSTRPS
jgi:hypothetical protein